MSDERPGAPEPAVLSRPCVWCLSKVYLDSVLCFTLQCMPLCTMCRLILHHLDHPDDPAVCGLYPEALVPGFTGTWPHGLMSSGVLLKILGRDVD